MILNLIDKKRKIRIPKDYNNSLAEFLGILMGDGYMGIYKNNHVVEIAGNSIKDKDYLENYVSSLFTSLFNFNPIINFRKNQNTMYLKAQSKSILIYLRRIGFKLGKKGKIKIPLWIKENNELMIQFVKGYFDTDGAISLKRKEGKLYPSISIGSISYFLLRDFGKFLFNREISSYLAKREYQSKIDNRILTSYQLQINGYNNILLFMHKIGSNNKRNIDRFHEMIKLRILKRL